MKEQWESNLCANIRCLRKKHSLSKTRMAKILGIGVKTLNQLENNVVPRRMSSLVVIRMSDYFNLPADALFHPIEK